MTRKDFEETLNAVLMEELDETLTAAEMTKLRKEIVARVELDWDPFEDPDPLDIGDDSSDLEEEEGSFSFSHDDDPVDEED